MCILAFVHHLMVESLASRCLQRIVCSFGSISRWNKYVTFRKEPSTMVVIFDACAALEVRCHRPNGTQPTSPITPAFYLASPS